MSVICLNFFFFLKVGFDIVFELALGDSLNGKKKEKKKIEIGYNIKWTLQTILP